LVLLSEALEHLDSGFENLPAFDTEADLDALRPVILATAERMRDNYSYQHPLAEATTPRGKARLCDGVVRQSE
jgi:hypothetical protein